MSRIINSIPISVKSSNRSAKRFAVSLDERSGNVPRTYVKLQQRIKHTHTSLVNLLLRRSPQWNILVLITTLASYLQITFTYLVCRPENSLTGCFYISVVCDVIFAFDIIMHAVRVLLLHQFTARVALVAAVDLALVFPFWYIYLRVVEADWVFLGLRFVCFLRMYKVVNFLREQRSKCANPALVLALETWFYFIVLTHGAACVWYYMACPFGAEECASWSIILNRIGVEPERPTHWYFFSLYYSYMINFNYGFVIPVNTFDEIIIATGLTLTIVLTMYFTANLFAIFVISNRRMMLIYMHLGQLRRRCERVKLDVDGLTRSYRLEWSYKRGVVDAKAAKLLPAGVTLGALFDINFPVLKSTLVFRNGSEAYLRHLSGLMKHEFFNDGDFVYRQDVEKTKMVIIVSGLIEIMSEEDDGTSIITFGPGTCLGESSLVYTLSSKTSVRAGRFVEIQSLYRHDFYKTIRHYPKQYNKVHRMIKSRTQEAMIKRMNAFSTFSRATSIKKIKNTIAPQKGSLFSLYRVHRTKTPHFVLNDSGLFLAWEILIAILALAVALLYPYFAAFPQKFPAWFEVPSMLAELVFVVDIFLVMITRTLHKNETKLRLKDVVLEKCNSFAFHVDVFAAFYFELFCYMFQNGDRYYYVLKLNRLLKVYKFALLLDKFEERFAFKVLFIRAFRYLALFLVFTFWFSAVGYMLACFGEGCGDGGWFKLKMLEERDNSSERPMFQHRCALSFYFVLSYVNAFEVHELRLRIAKDLVFVGIVLFFGVLYATFCVADLAAVCYLTGKPRLNFTRDLRLLWKFCKNHGMSPRLSKRLLNYYNLQWDYNGCYSVCLQQPPRLCERDLLVKEVLDSLRSVPLFADVDENFLGAIACRAKVYILPPTDIVTYYGSMNKELFIIKEGFCVYKTNGGVYKRIGPNTVFGMCSLFFNLSEVMLVRTLTHCKLVSIDGTALQEALNLYPPINDFIKEIQKEIRYNTFSVESESMPELNYHEHRGKMSFSDRFEWKKTFSEKGFINVVNFCKKHKESYSEPYRAADTFYLLKFILLPTTILPDRFFMHAWMALRLTAAYLYGILEPMQQIVSPYHVALHRFLVFLDVFSFIDLYVMLHVCCYAETSGALIVHPLRTAGNYIKRSFFLDFFIAFPYELFVVRFSGENHAEGESARAHRAHLHSLQCAVRLIRVLHVYKVFAAFRCWEDDIRNKYILVRFFKHLLLSVLFVNAWSCLLIFNTCRYLSSIDYEYLKRSDFSFYKHNISGLYCRTQSWLDRSDYAGYIHFWDVYVTAFYWTSSMMSGLNFGDLQVQGGCELLIAIFVQLFGLFYWCHLWVTILPHCLSLSVEVVAYKRMLRELVALMRREGIDAELEMKVVRNAAYVWRRTHSVDTTKLFSCLHTTLLQDTLSFLYEDTLRLVPLFGTMDRSFLRILALVVRPQYFLEGQVIVERDDIINEIYIVHRGTVSVKLARSSIKCDLIRGSLFGYYYNESIPNMSITATAISNVDVLCVRTVDYYDILKNYSKFNLKIQEVVSEYKDFMPSKEQDDRNAMNIIICERQVNRGSKLRVKHCTAELCCMPLMSCLDFLVLTASFANCLTRVIAFVHQTNHFFHVNIALEVVFVVRLVANFLEPYYDVCGELVTNRRMVRKNYLKRPRMVLFDFALVLLGCGTFAMFHPYLYFDHWFYYYTLVNLVTVVRLFYVRRYFNRRWLDLQANQMALRILCLLIWTSLGLHVLTDAWFMILCYDEDNCAGKEGVTLYMSSLYFILNLLTGTGTCQVALDSLLKKAFVVSVLIVPKFFLVFVLGAIINILWIFLKFPFKYRYATTELRDYFVCANVDKYQITNMLRYLKRLWCFDRGNTLPELLKSLPTPVANEVRVALYKPLLSNSYLFSNTEDRFLHNIALLLERVVYYEKNYIVHDGQIDETMYFIKSGEVEILTTNSNQIVVVHDVLHDGEMFGLAQGLFSGMPHQYTFRARIRCEILKLQLEHWDHLLGFYEKSKDIIYRRIRNLHMQLNK